MNLVANPETREKVKCATCRELGNYTEEEYEIFKKLLPRVVLRKTGTYLRGVNKVPVTKTAIYSAAEYLGAGFRSKNMNSIARGISNVTDYDELMKSMLKSLLILSSSILLFNCISTHFLVCDDGRGMEEFTQCRNCGLIKVQDIDDEVVVKKKTKDGKIKISSTPHVFTKKQEDDNVQQQLLNECLQIMTNQQQQQLPNVSQQSPPPTTTTTTTSTNCIVMDERDLMLGMIREDFILI